MAAPGLLPVIVQESWAQCENPNCNKWRKLPPGYEVKEDEPWYCYQNPDDRKATCSASEEEYKEAIVISGPVDAEEAEHNRIIRERLAAGLLASTSGAGGAASGGRGKGGRGKGRGRGRGRGRPPLSGRGSGGAAAAAEQGAGVDYFAGRRVRPGGPNYREDSDDDLDFLSEEERAPASGGRSTRRQQSAYSRHFQRLLENGGSWEAELGSAAGHGAAPFAAPPTEAWEGLGQHAPELAELACSAADVASSLHYFEGAAPGGVAGSDAADAVARLSCMLASAAALVATEDSLTEEERRSCCLDAASRAGTAAMAPAAAAAALPYGRHVQVPSGQPAAAAAVGVGVAGGWQQAALFPQQPAMQQQQQQQQLAMPQGIQLGSSMPQPAGVGWPASAQPNGQHQAMQQVQQPAAMPQYAQAQPAQQWQQPQWQQQAQQPQPQWQQQAQQPMQQQQQQLYGGQFGLPVQQAQQPSMPLMPGVTPDMIARYTSMLAQKPAGGQFGGGGGGQPASHLNGGMF